MATFSVIITTRNRPDLVASSIQSVLNQDFGDIEVLVSDNSSANEADATLRVVCPFLADARLRYMRPPTNMNMTSHWEWAVKQASGDYVSILTDRMVYRLNAISLINLYFQRHPQTKILAFKTANLIELNGGYAVPATNTVLLTRPCVTAEFIEAFSKSDFRRLDMPRFLNSFIRRDFLDELRAVYGGIFHGIYPDYNFFMKIADQLDGYPFIENDLLLKHAESISNGKSFTRLSPTETTFDFIELIKREQGEYLKFSPIPDDLMLISNGMIREYETGRQMAVNKLMPPYDKRAFYEESLKLVRAWNLEGKDTRSICERLERYRVDNKLTYKALSWKERRRSLRRRIRGILGRPRKSTPEEPKGAIFPTILEALESDLTKISDA